MNSGQSVVASLPIPIANAIKTVFCLWSLTLVAFSIAIANRQLEISSNALFTIGPFRFTMHALSQPPHERSVMSVYMVDRDLPGIQMDQLAAAQQAAIETSERFTSEGKPVRYIRTTFVPGEAHCMCLFEAENADHVREVNETAKIPFTRIVEALDLTP